MRPLVLWLLVLTVAGCGAQQQSASSPPSGSSSGATAVTAEAPKAIDISDQKLVYECPKCGMDFDKAGRCTMDSADLVAMNVSYVCPANNRTVARAGKCPDCSMDARIVKTAAAETPAASGSN